MKDVMALIEANPEYSLYTTGHSLGGALSTLFAFEVAADDRILNRLLLHRLQSRIWLSGEHFR
jgi:putative lipase involved disintegration of autophagic bodies